MKRLVHLWPALKAYFDRESEGSDATPNERVRRVVKLLSETKLYVLFVVLLFVR